MKVLVLVAVLALSGCSALTKLATNALGGGQGGINTELVVGDKEQTLGNNIEVKADEMGNVVGEDDNSVDVTADKVDKVVGSQEGTVDVTGSVDVLEVSNTNYPTWLIATLLGLLILFLCLPTPTTMWKWFKGRKRKKLEDPDEFK